MHNGRSKERIRSRDYAFRPFGANMRCLRRNSHARKRRPRGCTHACINPTTKHRHWHCSQMNLAINAGFGKETQALAKDVHDGSASRAIPQATQLCPHECIRKAQHRVIATAAPPDKRPARTKPRELKGRHDSERSQNHRRRRQLCHSAHFDARLLNIFTRLGTPGCPPAQWTFRLFPPLPVEADSTFSPCRLKTYGEILLRVFASTNE